MEEIQAEKSRPRAVRVVVVLALVAFLATCALFAAGRLLRGYSLRDALSPDVPLLELHVAFVDTLDVKSAAPKSDTESVESSGATTAEAPAAKEDTPISSSTAQGAGCPEVVGGDVGVTPPRRRRYYWEPTPVPCALVAKWNVLRNPVAASIFFVRGSDAIAWYESNPKVATFRQSALWKGMIRQVADTLKLRAEELQLGDWKGEFLQPLVRDALAADASFHYDLVHGAGGLVFAFDRTKARLVDKALPILIRGLATTAYTAEGYEQPLVEVRLFGRTLFLTQRGDRVVVASSLEGLINVVEQSPFAPPSEQGSVVAVLRPESFMDQLLVSSVGSAQWPLSVSFELSATASELSGATAPRARIFQTLAPHTASGVLAALPHDVMAAVALSSHVPLDEPVAEWSIKAERAIDPSGVGLVWDVSGKEKRFDVGIAVVTPTDRSISVGPSDFVSSKGVSTTCAGGAVWVAASSDALLGRMRESCEKQSLSIRDLKGLKEGSLEEQQVSLVFNSGVWLHEMFALGDTVAGENGSGSSEDTSVGAADDAENEAREKIRRMAAEIAPLLPILGLTGRLDPHSSDLRLKGFVSTHGGA